MNKKGNLNVEVFIVLFVGIIVGLALMTPIINTTNKLTSKQTTTNKSVDVTTAYIDSDDVNESINFTIYSQSDWKKSDCPLTSVAIRNGAGTALTKNTDYKLYTSEGVFSLVNTSKTIPSATSNLTYVDYTYCADGYNTDSSSRSIAGLVLIFTALALLGFVLEKSGIINMASWFRR